MSQTHLLPHANSPSRRTSRWLIFWLSAMFLIVLILGGIVGIDRWRASRLVVPKFEVGGKVVVRVVGPDGRPLEGAMVTPSGLRSEQSPGSGFGWSEKLHGPADTVVTGALGTAEIPFPKWTALESAMLTSGVSVVVEYPAFDSKWHVECPIGSSIPPVQLSAGGRVRLRVLRDGEDEPVTDFVANVSGELYRKEWKLDGDARVSPVLPLGERFGRVVHFDKVRGTQFSELLRFDSKSGRIEELEVRLQPGIKVRGRLDASVPRPVRNGFVIATVADETPNGDYDNCLSWQDWTAISEQGEFDFSALPPTAEVRVLAYCDGFVSRLPGPADVPAHMRRNHGWYSMPQFFRVSGTETNVEVVMEPAANARFKITDLNGKPLEGVDVALCPNVIYSTGSTLFGQALRPGNDYGKTFANYGEVMRGPLPWIEETSSNPDFLRPKFQAKTNSEGEVLIQNLPVRGKERVFVDHKTFVVRGQWRPPYQADITLELKPGLTESLTIPMEPKPELTPEMHLPPKPSLFEQLKEWVRKKLP